MTTRPQAVHIGDLHFAPGDRNVDRRRALGQIITDGLALPGLALWLVPGDLNDGRMSIEDRNFLKEELKRAAAAAPVVIVPGNHDVPGDVDIFADLKARWPVYVVKQPSVIRVELATGQTASIFCLPYPTKAGLTAQGVAPGQIITEAAVALDGIFQHAAAQLRDAEQAGDLTLMIGHVNVAGSMTSVGQPNIGREIELDPTLLARLGPIYKGLNHIHKAQSLDDAHYPGSICRLSWGEIEPKGYIVVEFAKAFTSTGWDFDVFRRSIDVAPMYHVEAELTRDGFFWQVKDGPEGAIQRPPLCGCTLPIEGSWCDVDADRVVPYRFGESLSALKRCTCCKGTGVCWRGCEVRVRYRFKQSEKSVLSDALLLAEFADALRLVTEPIAVPDRGLRSPEVAAARTLVEKVSAWCTVAGTPATDRLLQKLARLETGDHVQLLTEVQADLAAIEAGERELVSA